MLNPYTCEKGSLYKFLRNDAGDTSMNVNGSVTPVKFHYRAPDDLQCVLSRINISIFDAGPTGSEFGGIPALTNGITFTIEDKAGKILIDLSDGVGVKQNRGFGLLAGPDWALATGAGVDAVTVRWTFARAGRQLLLKSGQTFVCTVRDDLLAINDMGMMVQGYYLTLSGDLLT